MIGGENNPAMARRPATTQTKPAASVEWKIRRTMFPTTADNATNQNPANQRNCVFVGSRLILKSPMTLNPFYVLALTKASSPTKPASSARPWGSWPIMIKKPPSRLPATICLVCTQKWSQDEPSDVGANRLSPPKSLWFVTEGTPRTNLRPASL